MPKKILLSEIANYLGLTFSGVDRPIESCNTLEKAQANELSFLANPKYIKQVGSSKAGAILIHENFVEQITNRQTYALVSKNPYEDFAKVLQLFAKRQGEKQSGISPLAYIDESAKVDPSATIFPFAYIGENAVIGANSRIFSGVYIGEDCELGADCTLYPNAVLMAGTKLGFGCTIQAGAVIGSDGFGFVRTPHGIFKISQIGGVELGDQVEIGANTCIDCAALDKTRLGSRTCVDNLVQIGHNVQIGEECLIIAQNGISGSAVIGNRVTSAGQVGMAGHIQVGDDVVIGPQSGVTKSVENGKTVGGTPIVDQRTYMRTLALMPRFPEIFQRLNKIEKELNLKAPKE